jgi:hypothetical protein
MFWRGKGRGYVVVVCTDEAAVCFNLPQMAGELVSQR